MKLKVELQPLKGKYYGSEILLTNTEDGAQSSIMVWVNNIGSYEPSSRELEQWNQYNKENYPDDDEQYPYEISDDHFESEAALRICEAIVEKLNGMEV